MDRDRRLTGYLRGQTDNPIAPPGFELNNPWRVSGLADNLGSGECLQKIGREEDFVERDAFDGHVQPEDSSRRRFIRPPDTVHTETMAEFRIVLHHLPMFNFL